MSQKKDRKHYFSPNEQSLLNILTMLQNEVIELIKKTGKLERRVVALEEKGK